MLSTVNLFYYETKIFISLKRLISPEAFLSGRSKKGGWESFR